MRHLAANGRPFIEAAEPRVVHILEVAHGPTAETSPAVGVEVEVRRSGDVRVTHWIAGERFRVIATASRA